MLSFEVTAVSKTDTQLAVSARQFEFIIDEPPTMGGTDAGPNPIEYELGSLLGCLNIVVHLVAREKGVTLTSFSAKAKGDLDPGKLMGADTEARAGFQFIEVTMEVEGDADQAVLDEICKISEARCPVSDNLGNATPVTIKIANKA